MAHKHAEEVVTEKDFVEVLKSHSFRVTSGKINLLSVLNKAQKPLSVIQILELWKGKKPDQATLYRSLTNLANKGIIKRIDLNTGTAHFEYTPSNPHHHHLICSDCGTVEDVAICSIDTLENKIIKKSKAFKSIYSHNLEFFGHCTSCQKQ